MSILNMVCSSCGAQLKFDNRVLNSIVCDFCGVKTDVSELNIDDIEVKNLPRKCVLPEISEKKFTEKLEQLLNLPQFKHVDKDMPTISAKELLFHPIGFFKGSYTGTYDVLNNQQKVVEPDNTISGNFDIARSVGDFTGTYFPDSDFLKKLFSKLPSEKFTTTQSIEKKWSNNQTISTLMHIENDVDFIKTVVENTIFEELDNKNKNSNHYRVNIELDNLSSEIIYYPFWYTTLDGTDDMYIDAVYGDVYTTPNKPLAASVKKNSAGCMPVLIMLILIVACSLYFLF